MVAKNQGISKIQNRVALIDSLRGIAAISVVGFHFYCGSPLHSSLSKIFPSPMAVVLEHGYLGVEIFFVISGFVIAYSLRKSYFTADAFFKFMFFRFLRLSPPYWATVFLTILFNAISNFILTDRRIDLPSINSILAHLFYLQGILEFNQISPVFWTLCLEMQFYVAFFILLGCKQYLLNQNKYVRTSVILFAVIFSALIPIALESSWLISNRSMISQYWHMFLMGSLTYWTFEKKLGRFYFWIFSLILILNFLVTKDIGILVILFTGFLIYLASKHNDLNFWLGHKWLQYLGRISYSIYLTHVLVGTRVINLGYRLTGDSKFFSLLLFIFAFATSIVAAHIMYLYIEKPSLRLSKKLKEQGKLKEKVA